MRLHCLLVAWGLQTGRWAHWETGGHLAWGSVLWLWAQEGWALCPFLYTVVLTKCWWEKGWLDQDVGLWCQAVGELWPLRLHPALLQKPP